MHWVKIQQASSHRHRICSHSRPLECQSTTEAMILQQRWRQQQHDETKAEAAVQNEVSKNHQETTKAATTQPPAQQIQRQPTPTTTITITGVEVLHLELITTTTTADNNTTSSNASCVKINVCVPPQSRHCYHHRPPQGPAIMHATALPAVVPVVAPHAR